MLAFNQSVIVNVEVTFIETYLKKEKLFRTKEEEERELKYWIDNLLEQGKNNIEKFENFLFNELLWRKRKTIRVYKLDKIKDYKYSSDWEIRLKKQYDNVRKHEVARLGEHIRTLLMVSEQGVKLFTSAIYVTEVESNG